MSKYHEKRGGRHHSPESPILRGKRATTSSNTGSQAYINYRELKPEGKRETLVAPHRKPGGCSYRRRKFQTKKDKKKGELREKKKTIKKGWWV